MKASAEVKSPLMKTAAKAIPNETKTKGRLADRTHAWGRALSTKRVVSSCCVDLPLFFPPVLVPALSLVHEGVPFRANTRTHLTPFQVRESLSTNQLLKVFSDRAAPFLTMIASCTAFRNHSHAVACFAMIALAR